MEKDHWIYVWFRMSASPCVCVWCVFLWVCVHVRVCVGGYVYYMYVLCVCVRAVCVCARARARVRAGMYSTRVCDVYICVCPVRGCEFECEEPNQYRN